MTAFLVGYVAVTAFLSGHSSTSSKTLCSTKTSKVIVVIAVGCSDVA